MSFDDSGVTIYQAGEVVPAGHYSRVDDSSYHVVLLAQPGPLPPSFDGHVALYRAAGGIASQPDDAVTTSVPAPRTLARVEATVHAL